MVPIDYSTYSIITLLHYYIIILYYIYIIIIIIIIIIYVLFIVWRRVVCFLKPNPLFVFFWKVGGPLFSDSILRLPGPMKSIFSNRFKTGGVN